MRQLLTISLILILFSCDTATKTKNTTQTIDCNIALKFINDYVKISEPSTTSINHDDWVMQHGLLTDSFKSRYKFVIDSGWKAEPEVGLDFDPIFDGNSFPKGFEMVNCDNENGYVTVKGVDWPDFVLVLKLIKQDNITLIDGSGIINVPVDKRARK